MWKKEPFNIPPSILFKRKYYVAGRVKAIKYQGGRIGRTSSICLEGKFSFGIHFTLPFFPATHSSQCRTLEALFELPRHPSRALNLASSMLPELQRTKDTVRCDPLGSGVQGHCRERLTQTLIARLLKMHLFIIVPKTGRGFGPTLYNPPCCVVILQTTLPTPISSLVGGRGRLGSTYPFDVPTTQMLPHVHKKNPEF